ncbi:MAG: hypothetical protein IJ583_17335 [Firmicutes bacterium]|nr:hypothetical protein [Bacillota bacterium]
MDCSQISKILSENTPDSISSENMETVLSHIENCPDCAEQFALFMENITIEDNLLSEDFEKNVMLSINEEEKQLENDNKICTLWSILSVSFGTVSAIILGRLEILSFLRTQPILNNFSDYFLKATNAYYTALSYTESISSSFISTLNMYIENLKYASLLACFILVIAQFLLYKREHLKA